MKKMIVASLAVLSAAFAQAEQMMTTWGEKVTPENAWRSYPRPHMVRDGWTNLNGQWDYAITSVTNTPGRPEKWDGKILVPFPLESSLSGVGRLLEPDEFLWYTRKISCDPKPGERILLHFGGVDFRTMVFIGHDEVTDVPHEGGQNPFTLDITDFVKKGENTLTVCVWDPTEDFVNSRGKQSFQPKGCFYTRVSGIWQTVWMETVPEKYIKSYKVFTDIDKGTVRFEFDKVDGAGEVEVTTDMPKDFECWSPENPKLYSFTAKYGKDVVKGYFGMRKFEKRKDERGVLRFFLNNKPYFLIGTLDQGWWPDGLLTPPSEEAMEYDVKVLKDCGFNMLRKHIKVEPQSYYAMCDRLGILVIQDLPSGDGKWSDPMGSEVVKRYWLERQEMKEMMDDLQPFASIVMWNPYNEGWTQPGEFLTHYMLDFTKRYDPSRLVNGPSGCWDWEGGHLLPKGWKWENRVLTQHKPAGVCEAADTVDMHLYRGPTMFAVNDNRISFLGEFGGLGHPVEGHLWKVNPGGRGNWGYGGIDDTKTREGLEKTYLGLMDKLGQLAEWGLGGSVYTQTTDVEIEVNGLLTYDRKVLKYNPEVLKKAHAEVIRRALEAPRTGLLHLSHVHRGGGKLERPDNTLETFKWCWENGSALECDCRKTKDGVGIMLHDKTLKRTARGISEDMAKKMVSDELTWDEIKDVDVGSYLAPRFSNERIPTIEATFAAMKGHPTYLCFVDEKGAGPEYIAQKAREAGVLDQVYYTGQDYPKALDWNKATNGGKTLIWIGTWPKPKHTAEDIARFEAHFEKKMDEMRANCFKGVSAVSLHTYYDPKAAEPFVPRASYLKKIIAEFHANQIPVCSIPFEGGETEEVYFKLHELGCDGFSTDYPSVMFSVIRKLKARATCSQRVEFRDCPKCDKRIRIDLAAGKAYVNLSRLEGADRDAVAARAARILAASEILPASDPKIRPLMGWSSWNTFGVDISEGIILDTARAMSTNGLKDAGYTYVNIDDGFFWGHGEDGILRFHPERFPNGMKPVVDGIHSLGLKAGIYSDAGADTCGSMYGGGGGKDKGGIGGGLYGHDAADCKLHFNDLGFDFIKVDYCGARSLKLDEKVRYTEISEAIKATGRTDVRLNLCRWAFPGTWAADIAESWRTTPDIRANWKSVKGLIAENLYLSAYAKPGHYNDMDMLEVGQLVGQMKTAFGKHGDTGLTSDEETTHFGIWCMLSSPLLIGCDVRRIPASTKRLITNPYLLAVNQNDLGCQAYVARREGDAYILVKDACVRFGKSRYVALLNLSDAEHEFIVRADDLDLGGAVDAFDLVEMADVGRFEGCVSVKVAPHASKFYRLDAERRVQRRVYEAETAFLTDYQELRDPAKAGTAFPAQCEGASGGVIVRFLGNRDTNDIVWREVKVDATGDYAIEFAYSSPDDRSFDVFVDGVLLRGVSAKATGGKLSAVGVTARLSAGVHEVRLSNATSWMPDIDLMTIASQVR